MDVQPEAVLAFWFGAPGSATEIAGRQSKLWFGKSPANDEAVIERFAATLAIASAGGLDRWADTPRGRLALVIVLDQFPHHIFRDRPQAFASDPQALRLTLDALAADEDRPLMPIERVFLYLPLEHAESLEMQELAVSLYEKLAIEAPADERALFDGFLDYARRHRDVVARFGRFPHRNTIDRYLGAFPENARPRLPLHVRRRHPRHRDHATRGEGRHHAGNADWPGVGRTHARLRRLSYRLRPLLLDAFRREPRTGVDHLPAPERSGADRGEDDCPVV